MSEFYTGPIVDLPGVAVHRGIPIAIADAMIVAFGHYEDHEALNAAFGDALAAHHGTSFVNWAGVPAEMLTRIHARVRVGGEHDPDVADGDWTLHSCTPDETGSLRVSICDDIEHRDAA